MACQWQIGSEEHRSLTDLSTEHLERGGMTFTSSPRPSGDGSSDDGVVGGGTGADRMLDDAGEAVAEALGGAAVEAENELVEIGRQVLGRGGAVVGAEQPALGQAEHQVDRGQAQRRVAPAGGQVE